LKKTGHLSQKPKKLVRSSLPKIGGFDFDFSKICGILEKYVKIDPRDEFHENGQHKSCS
jgi:hypothetical protein